jgi:transposase
VEKLAELEKLSEQGLIDLFYGDETHVCSEGYVPYGWHFPGEEVAILVEKGHKINCFGLINRHNQCHWAMTQHSIDSAFIGQFLDELSLKIQKETCLVLDNARIHRAKLIQERIPYWQKRGLYIFFLPPYSPQLNIAETLWRIMKTKWIDPDDYLEKDALFYAVNRCFANIGKKIVINFSDFNVN